MNFLREISQLVLTGRIGLLKKEGQIANTAVSLEIQLAEREIRN